MTEKAYKGSTTRTKITGADFKKLKKKKSKKSKKA